MHGLHSLCKILLYIGKYLHSVVTCPKRQIAEAGLLARTCTVTVLPTTCGVLPEKCTLRGPEEDEVVTVGVVKTSIKRQITKSNCPMTLAYQYCTW